MWSNIFRFTELQCQLSVFDSPLKNSKVLNTSENLLSLTTSKREEKNQLNYILWNRGVFERPNN